MTTVTLIADQELPAAREYRVCKGGEYAEYDLVEVYQVDDPDKKGIVAFHAGFIVQGNDFYNPKTTP